MAASHFYASLARHADWGRHVGRSVTSMSRAAFQTLQRQARTSFTIRDHDSGLPKIGDCRRSEQTRDNTIRGLGSRDSNT